MWLHKSCARLYWPTCTYVPTHPLQLDTELIRLEELKRVNMQKFIEATRVELVKVWDQCFFGHHQRQEFSPYFEGVCTCGSDIARPLPAILCCADDVIKMEAGTGAG